jgi:hypothetical protein
MGRMASVALPGPPVPSMHPPEWSRM